jgi:uncharacterized protein
MKVYDRILKQEVIRLADKFPVVSVTGPRQSGKTTLIRSAFPEYRYENLENPDTRLFAQKDPRSFLKSDGPMIVDEIQRVPDLFSYIQTITDMKGQTGQFIISGSQSFLLNERISQSLAGRVAILHLLPLSYIELQSDRNFSFPGYEEIIYNGFYPRLYDKQIDPQDFYPNYIQTYIERDVRLLQNIQDLDQFNRFLKLCAGRTGQLLNISSLANDAGVSANTAKAWISVLEASFIIYLLRPHHVNFNKRLIKMPKLYFYDTGLVCSLLDVSSAEQLNTHYLLGALFETFVLSELLKARFNKGLRSNLYFWRDHKGNEIDCLADHGQNFTAIEIKAGRTYTESYFDNLRFWNKLSGNTEESSFVIYGGEKSFNTKYGHLLGWKNLAEIPL